MMSRSSGIGERFVLRSPAGATAVLAHDPHETLVAVSLRVSAGSRHDPPRRSGLAHMVEHLMYARDPSLEEAGYLRLTQSLGGIVNANTSADWCKYFSVVGSDLLDLVLGLEIERFSEPARRFRAQALVTEREVILNERRQRMENVAFGTGVEHLVGLLFPAPSPYHRLPVGLPADLDAMTVDECARFTGAHYTAPRVHLTIAGSFDPDKAARRVMELLDVFAPGSGSPDAEEPTAPAPTRRVELPSPVGTKVFLGVPLPSERSHEFSLANLACFHLGRGSASALSGILVDRLGLASSVVVKTMGREHGASVGVIELVPAPGVAADALVSALDHCLPGLIDDVSESDVSRARSLYAAGWLSDFDSLLRRNDWLSLFLQHHRSVEPYFAHDEVVAGFGAEDLRHGLRLWNRPAHRAEVVFTP